MGRTIVHGVHGLLTLALAVAATIVIVHPSWAGLSRSSTIDRLRSQVDALRQQGVAQAATERGDLKALRLGQRRLKLYARATWDECRLVRSWSTYDPTAYQVSPLARAMAQVCNDVGVPTGGDAPDAIAP